MNERIKELEVQAIEYANQQNTFDPRSEFSKKFAELIVSDYARQLVQANMHNPAYAQAMDEYYENKWSHRFD